MKKALDKKTIKKETTIDDLAGMVAKGFDEMHEEMNDRFDEVDTRFDRLENTISKIDTRVESIDRRLKKVEESLEPLSLGYRIMSKELQELNSRVFRLEKKVGVSK